MVDLRFNGVPLDFYRFQEVTCALRGAFLTITNASRAIPSNWAFVTITSAVGKSRSPPASLDASVLNSPTCYQMYPDGRRALAAPGALVRRGLQTDEDVPPPPLDPNSPALDPDVQLTVLVELPYAMFADFNPTVSGPAVRRLSAPTLAEIVAKLQALAASTSGPDPAIAAAATAMLQQAQAIAVAEPVYQNVQAQMTQVTTLAAQVLAVADPATLQDQDDHDHDGDHDGDAHVIVPAVVAPVGVLLLAGAAFWYYKRVHLPKRVKPASGGRGGAAAGSSESVEGAAKPSGVVFSPSHDLPHKVQEDPVNAV